MVHQVGTGAPLSLQRLLDQGGSSSPFEEALPFSHEQDASCSGLLWTQVRHVSLPTDEAEGAGLLLDRGVLNTRHKQLLHFCMASHLKFADTSM